MNKNHKMDLTHLESNQDIKMCHCKTDDNE